MRQPLYRHGPHPDRTRGERQRLLTEAAGLVEPLSFIFPCTIRAVSGPKVFGGLLAL
jgi:hypothetical protein